MPTTETSTEKSTLLFGGSFDPVHRGHEYILEKALEKTDYERIIVMPAHLSNFKQDSRPACAADRLNMLHLAFDGLDTGGRELVISTYEIDRGGVSYSYDTVMAMYGLYAIRGRLGFLMGDDLVSGLERWYRWNDLRDIVDFVVFTRDASHISAPPGARLSLIQVTPFHASSSEVRAGALDELVPSVKNYVIEHGLYDTGENRKGE